MPWPKEQRSRILWQCFPVWCTGVCVVCVVHRFYKTWHLVEFGWICWIVYDLCGALHRSGTQTVRIWLNMLKKSWFLLNCSSFKSVSTWLNSWYVGWTRFANCLQSAAFCTAHIWNNFRRVNELFLHRPNTIFNSIVYPKLINLVYRANPTDNPNNLNGFFGSSRSVAKGAYGIGDVVVEPLRDVWKVRK